MSKKIETITYLYAGIRVDASGSKRYAYMEYPFIGDGIYDLYKKKLLGYESIGTLIMCDKRKDGVGGNRKTINWDGSDISDTIADWTAQDRASQEITKARTEAKKEHPASVTKLVDELKESMYKLNRQQKDAFATWVFKQLLR